jgi:hypothetical protein
MVGRSVMRRMDMGRKDVFRRLGRLYVFDVGVRGPAAVSRVRLLWVDMALLMLGEAIARRWFE